MKTHANCHTTRSAHASVERSRNEHQSSKFSWAGIYRRALWLALAASIVWTGASLVPPGEQTVDAQGITPVAAAAADAPSYHYTAKPIEQIKEGDYVLARNPATGEIEKKRVEATFIRTCDHIRVLDFQTPNGDIQRHETTDEHPYYLPQLDTFVNAADLRTGDQVTGPNGERQRLIASTRRDEPDGITVYNFSVEDHHVYFVAGRDSGRIPVLVHNADWDDYIDDVPRRRGDPRRLDRDALDDIFGDDGFEVWEGRQRFRVGMERRPRHHAIPQEAQRVLDDHGVDMDIDEYTIELGRGEHDAIHGGGNWRLGRRLHDELADTDDWVGEYNREFISRLNARIEENGGGISRDEVLEIMHGTLDDFGLDSNFVPYNAPIDDSPWWVP